MSNKSWSYFDFIQLMSNRSIALTYVRYVSSVQYILETDTVAKLKFSCLTLSNVIIFLKQQFLLL